MEEQYLLKGGITKNDIASDDFLFAENFEKTILKSVELLSVAEKIYSAVNEKNQDLNDSLKLQFDDSINQLDDYLTQMELQKDVMTKKQSFEL